MDNDKEALCSTASKNYLHLTLEQPTKCNLDLEAGGDFSDIGNENASEQEVESDAAVDEDGNNGESEGKSGSSKIPPLYQVCVLYNNNDNRKFLDSTLNGTINPERLLCFQE